MLAAVVRTVIVFSMFLAKLLSEGFSVYSSTVVRSEIDPIREGFLDIAECKKRR